jgi:hypothetical protein
MSASSASAEKLHLYVISNLDLSLPHLWSLQMLGLGRSLVGSQLASSVFSFGSFFGF